MQKISSDTTYFYKRIFPVLWIGMLVLIPAIVFLTIPKKDDIALIPVSIVPVFVIPFGYFLMRALIFDLMDEVWDDGTTLVVKNKDREARIPLSDIMNISFMVSRPPRATLTLRKECCFGTTVTFSPKTKFSFNFWKNQIVDDLIIRIDEQRRKDRG